MPCEAGKTSRNPVGVFTFLGAIARLAPKLAALVKGQVFSMSLNRRKFDEKPHGSIRRKDFIDDITSAVIARSPCDEAIQFLPSLWLWIAASLRSSQ
jgi:hypothetical protein